MSDRPNRAAALRLIDRSDPLAGPRPRLAAARRDVLAMTDGPAVASIEITGVIDGIAEQKLRRELDAAKRARRLSVRLDSYGGSVKSAFAMHRALREHGSTVLVHVGAECASAACILLAAGDARSAGPSSKFLLHAAAMPPSGGTARWTARRHEAQARFIAEADEAIIATLSERCGVPRERLMAELATEQTLHAGAALGLGLVHWLRGVTSRPEPRIAEWYVANCYCAATRPFAVCGPFTRPGFLEACRVLAER